MRTPVTHCDEYIALAQLYHRLEDFFAANVHFRGGIVKILTVTKQNRHWIVVLNKLHFTVIHEVHDREG